PDRDRDAADLLSLPVVTDDGRRSGGSVVVQEKRRVSGGGLRDPDGRGSASAGDGLSDVESGGEGAVVPVRGAGGDARGNGNRDVGGHTDRSLTGGHSEESREHVGDHPSPAGPEGQLRQEEVCSSQGSE